MSLHQLFSVCLSLFHFLWLHASHSLLTLSINTLSTPQSHFNICHENASHFTPVISVPWGQFWHGCSYLLWQAGSLDVSLWWHGALLSLSVSDRAWFEKPGKGTRAERQPKWEWGHFPCKEIKVKRKIKVWFPASWFAFYTEIPFFLSDFAETTIAPLPVLVTVTPLTLSLGACALLHLP